MNRFSDKINAKLNAQGGFLKAVSVLVGGTAFAQVVGFISLPILTRLYSPEDYSILGIYIAFVSILSVVTCLRFDIAIPIPDSDSEGRAILSLALISNIIFILFLYLLLILIYPWIEHIKIIKDLSSGIWLIPLGVLLAGTYSILQFWATRKKRFKDIAKTRMTQAIASNSTSLVIGFTNGSFFGLILGQLLNFGGGILKLGISTYKDIIKCKSDNLIIAFRKYQDFPKYSTFEALANASTIQLPLIIIAVYLTGPEIGYLMLAMKILALPMGLIGTAISQVYVSEAGEYYKKQQLYKYSLNIVYKILKLICIPFVILAIVSPFIFKYIFGEQWSELGDYILAMIPWFFFQMLVSPISMVLYVVGKQRLALIIQILGFFLRVGILLVLILINFDYLVEYYLFSGFIFYILYLVIVLFSIKSF